MIYSIDFFLTQQPPQMVEITLKIIQNSKIQAILQQNSLPSNTDVQQSVQICVIIVVVPLLEQAIH